MTTTIPHIDTNYWNTTDLTLSVMSRIADRLGLDIEDSEVADKLYSICSDLESWPPECGFGSSDIHSYLTMAEDMFNVEAKSLNRVQHHYIG